MSAILAFIASLWRRLAADTAKLALWTGVLAILGPIAPIITGIAQMIGGVVTAIGEILASLSKSPEGRVALCLLAAGMGFIYLRFHYIEEGKAEARAQIAALRKPCPVTSVERRKR
jgi:hypothetical protein